jgi:hypothetical protein
MSALVATHMSRPSFGLLNGLRSFRAHEPRLFDLGALLLIAMLPTAFAALVDPRLFQGINVWDKPMKFEFALGVYLLTLVFFARFLPAGTTGKRWYRAYAAVVIVAIVAEMLWIGGAAAMAIPSHFSETPLGGAIYGLMGVAAVILTSLSMVYALQIRRNAATGLSPAVKESLVLGLALVLPLTLITAGTMSSMGGHWVGGAPTDAGSLALIGWARDGGDLRVAHFFATHAMHFIPVFGLVSAQLAGPDNKTPVRVFSGIFAAFVSYTFVEALMGRPFLPVLG